MKPLLLLFLLSAPAAAFAQSEIRFTDVRDLGKEYVWGALEPEGKRALLVTRNSQSPRFTFTVVEVDSGKTTIAHDSDVNMDDFMAGLVRPDCFSPDGTSVILPTRSAERAPDQWGGGRILIAREGAKVWHGVAASRSTTWFGAWSKDGKHVYFIEAGHRKELGYAIRKQTDRQYYETLYENRERLACHLRASPDGRRLAFLDFPGRNDEVRLVVLNGADKSIVESEKFPVDDFGGDGVVPFHWESDQSIIFHRSPAEPRASEPERMHAWRFDLRSRKTEAMRAGDTAPFFVTAPAGEGRWLASRAKGKRLESFIVQPDGKSIPLPDQHMAVSAAAVRWLVWDLKRRTYFVARPEWSK